MGSKNVPGKLRIVLITEKAKTRTATITITF